MDEKELEVVHAWLHDQDLLFGTDSKDLPLEWAVHMFYVLSKYQFRDTIGEAMRCTFLHLVLCKDKLAAVQMEIKWVWDPNYYYYLDLTNMVPIQNKPLHL